MRQLLLELGALIVALTITLAVSAQTEQTKVTLKNGVVVTGIVKTFDPISHIELEVGGILTRIDMTNVEKVERAEPAPAGGDAAPAQTPRELPKEKILNIAGVDVKFVLVEGGSFSYGYDGVGSRAMNSEPVHSITLSSFYVTEQPLKQALVKAVTGSNYLEKFKLVASKRRMGYRSMTDQEPVTEQNCDVAFFNAVEDGGQLFQFGARYKRVDELPSAPSFLAMVRSQSNNNSIDVLTEAQWAYIKTTGKSHVSMPFAPEVCKAIDMYTEKDPVGTSWMLKGAHWIIQNGWVAARVNGIQNRYSIPLHEIDDDDDDMEVEIGNGDQIIAPMHLVMPAE